MKRQLGINWVLVVAALGSLIAVFVTRDRVTSGELMRREQNLLQVFEESAVSRIVFEANTGRFALARNAAAGPEEFAIVEPIEERAKVEKVSSLLGSLRFASFLRRVDEAQGTAFGLERPRWVLHVDHGNVHYRLRLGGQAPSPPGSSYLEVTGENVSAKGVFVVRDGLVDELTLKLDEFRSHELAAIGQSSLAELGFQGGAIGQWKVKQDAGRWRFADASAALVDRDRIERFFTQLARLKLETFLDLSAAHAALGSQPWQLVLVPKEARLASVQIEIGGPCPNQPQWLVAVRSQGTSSAGCVSKEIAEELKIDPDALKERHLFSLRHDEVESVELTRAEGKLAFARSESGFRMTAPTEGNVETEIAEQLLKDWLSLTGEPRGELRQVSLAEPRATLLLRAVSDVATTYREQRLELGTLVGKPGVFAVRSSDSAVLQLAQLDLEQLDVTGLALRSRAVLDLQARQLARIEVKTPSIHQVITQANLGPMLAEPQGYDSDGSLLVELVDTLRGLRAMRWVAASDRDEFALAEPWARVTFTVAAVPNKPEDHLLRLGASTRGGFFAQLDQGPVFVIGRRSAETFDTWVLDRAVFSPPLDAVQRLELSAERGSLKLQRSGQRFEQLDSRSPIASGDLEALLTELDTLRPEAALHLGPALPNEGFGKPLLRYVAERADGSRQVAWTIGGADMFRNLPVYFARVDGVAATYVIARGPVQRVLDLL